LKETEPLHNFLFNRYDGTCLFSEVSPRGMRLYDRHSGAGRNPESDSVPWAMALDPGLRRGD
jgi:hypothetical protein